MCVLCVGSMLRLHVCLKPGLAAAAAALLGAVCRSRRLNISGGRAAGVGHSCLPVF